MKYKIVKEIFDSHAFNSEGILILHYKRFFPNLFSQSKFGARKKK